MNVPIAEPAPDRLLFGSLPDVGWEVRWLELSPGQRGVIELGGEWLTVVLNFLGPMPLVGKEIGVEGAVQAEEALVVPGGSRIERGEREAGHLHRAAIIRCCPGWVEARRLISGRVLRVAGVKMPTALLGLRQQLVDPPVPAVAAVTWAEGKVLEVLAHVLWAGRKQRGGTGWVGGETTRAKVERALFLLERDLENPPGLRELAREVGCSPFSLSRWLAQETGLSMPAHLRRLRIERAARLLAEGRMNVTEAAMAVGYSSLSAFNTAFVQQMGCCPGLYQGRGGG